MKLDLAKIDAQIEKLQSLKKIAADPELLGLLETLMLNGNGVANGAAPIAVTDQTTAAISPRLRLKQGTVVRAVADNAAMQLENFTAYTLAEEMIREGYHFQGKTKPGVIVGDILRSVLIPKGIVRIVRKGKGSDPAVYRRIL